MSDQTSLQKETAKIEALIASLRDALTGDALEQALLPLEQKRNQLIAQLSGAGAVAQGENAVAAGQDATVIQHSTIVYAAEGARVVIGDQPVEMKAELRYKALGRYLDLTTRSSSSRSFDEINSFIHSSRTDNLCSVL